jgi:hypothetical protein
MRQQRTKRNGRRVRPGTGRRIDRRQPAHAAALGAASNPISFDDVLRFRTRLISYDGNTDWVDPTIRDVADCLSSDRPPAASANCEFCNYIARAAAIS